MSKETGWQSGERSFIIPGLPTHVVQELNVGTALWIFQLYSRQLLYPCNGPDYIFYALSFIEVCWMQHHHHHHHHHHPGVWKGPEQFDFPSVCAEISILKYISLVYITSVEMSSILQVTLGR